MAHTLVAWDESQDTAGALLAMEAVVDQSVTTNDDDVLVPGWALSLMAIMVSGADAVRAQMTAPSLRRASQLDVGQVDSEALPSGIPAMLKLFDFPRLLEEGEGLRALIAEDGAGASRHIIGAILGNGIDPVPDGEVETVRFAGTTTLTANAWSICPMTPDQQLRAGAYAIVGARFQSVSGVLGRLVIPGSAFRPGGWVYRDEDDEGHEEFRYGGLGVWGTFKNTFVPQLELLATAGDTAQAMYLDVIRIGE